MEIFLFDRPVPLENIDTKLNRKCTCYRRQNQRPTSSPVNSSKQSPPSPSETSTSTNESTPRVNTPNKHSTLMQAATISAYHTVEPQRSTMKSCSLLNDTEPLSGVQNQNYDFVDSTKKASYLIGSARCTLVTASAAVHTNQTPTNHVTTVSTSSRTRFRKSMPSR